MLGLIFVGLLLAWLIVNLIKNPTDFFNVLLIGFTQGAVYALVALGYTLVYGILQLINFAHGDVFALTGLVATTFISSLFGLDTGTAVLTIGRPVAIYSSVLVGLMNSVASFKAKGMRQTSKPLQNEGKSA